MDNNERFEAQISALHTKVTGSCLPLDVLHPNGKTDHGIIDCGLFQEGAKILTSGDATPNPSKVDKKSTSKKYVYVPKTLSEKLNSTLPFNAKDINWAICTHNHLDHTGRFPLLVRRGFEGNIYMSNSTKKLMKIGLADACKVLTSNAKINHSPPLYNGFDVEKTFKQSVGCDFDTEIYINSNTRLNFFKNGHLPGAVVSLFRISPKERFDPYCKNNINILYTGDYCSNNMFFDVPPLPNWVLNLPISIITESTYGYMDSSAVNYCFVNNLLKAIKEGKTILIDVFSLGRAQNIIYLIRQLQDQNLVGKTGEDYNALFKYDGLDNNPECRGSEWQTYRFLQISGNMELQQRMLKDNKPKIILATGGMCSHGAAQTLTPKILNKTNGALFIVGYCAEGTLGRKIQDTPQGEVIDYPGIPPTKKIADVYVSGEFSKHEHRDGLVRLYNQFEHPLLIATNHGEIESQKVLADYARRYTKAKNVEVIGSSTFRIGPKGLIAIKPNNFPKWMYENNKNN